MTKTKTESGDHHGHPIVSLASENLQLRLAPSIGGAIAAFQFKTSGGRLIDLMRPMDAMALAAGDVLGASCFPLTPFSNRLRNGAFTFKERQIKLPLNSDGPHTEHGHGWQRPWQVERQTDNLATLLYRHSPDDWSFAYEIRQHFSLSGSRLCITLESHNTGTTAMPYGFGLHPYFVRTDQCRLAAPVEGFWLVDEEVMPTELVSVPAAANLTDGISINDVELDNAYSGWSGNADITWPEYRLHLAMRASAPLRFLVVYVPKGEAYFCAEPVSNSTDAFNLCSTRSDTGMLILEPGDRVQATISFSVDGQTD